MIRRKQPGHRRIDPAMAEQESVQKPSLVPGKDGLPHHLNHQRAHHGRHIQAQRQDGPGHRLDLGHQPGQHKGQDTTAGPYDQRILKGIRNNILQKDLILGQKGDVIGYAHQLRRPDHVKIGERKPDGDENRYGNKQGKQQQIRQKKQHGAQIILPPVYPAVFSLFQCFHCSPPSLWASMFSRIQSTSRILYSRSRLPSLSR